MTVEEFRDKGFCYLCSYGDKVYNHAIKLSSGMWCKEEQEKLVALNNLLNIYLFFDTQDLPDFTEEHNSISKQDFEDLMIKIEGLL
jgi:hypothetical protein